MTIIVLYDFRYKKLSKPCPQLLRYKQPVTVTSPLFNSKLQHGQYHTQKWSVSNAGIYEKYFISHIP